jgi:hypothetical protein
VCSSDLQVEIGPKETMKLAEAPPPKGWLEAKDGPNWAWRCPVHVFNFDVAPKQKPLIAADLRRTLGLLGPQTGELTFAVVRDGKVVPSSRSEANLLFSAGVPARSAARFDLYAALRRGAKPEQPASDLALVNSEANLLKNPSYEQGGDVPTDWTFSEQREGETAVKFRREKREGGWCARMDVPKGAPASWPGWHQVVPVKPNSSYFYAASLKCENLDGATTIYAHIHNAEGKLVQSNGMTGGDTTVSGTQDWTRVRCFFRTPGDAASVELHLTTNCRGTLWHDDVVFAEMVMGTTGGLESRRPAARQQELTAWEVNPLVKVFPDSPPGPQSSEAVVRLARNEYEPVQLVLHTSDRVRSVEVSVPRPTGPGGAKLDEVALNLVGFVPVDFPSSYYSSELPAWYRLVPTGQGGCDGWAGEWPDPLPPLVKPFSLEPDRAQPVWLTIHAPRDAKPGEYRSTVQIRPSEGKPVQIPLRIVVWNFALPDESHCKAEYDCRDAAEYAPASAKTVFERMKPWYRLMASRRVCPGVILPTPKFEYKDGRVTMDTTDYDAAASFCLDELKMAMFYTPWDFYSFGWGYPPKDLFGVKYGTPEYGPLFQSMYRQFLDHCQQKGWKDRLAFYISDEPDLTPKAKTEQYMIEMCRLAHEVDPKVPIYCSTWNYKPEWNGSLTLWGVGQFGCFPVKTMEERLKAGDRIWFTTDGQMCLDTPYLACERLLPYYCFKYDVQGYEFWGVNWWTYNPWERGWHQYIRQSFEGTKFSWVRYPNGDGYLTYPGKPLGQDDPVSSIRLEQAREGVEDYEYFFLLRNLIAKAKDGPAKAAAQKALDEAMAIVTIPNKGGRYSTAILPHPDAVPAARLKIGEAIEKLSR